MLVNDFDDLCDRIERSAEWAIGNSPLQPDETATVQLMIKSQIARGLERGDFDVILRMLGCKNLQRQVRVDGGCVACAAGQGEACRMFEALL
ncbi:MULTISPECIES: hypothetical protein [unclassified Mesorhizobium]|uniref:hypothetical protein n=2 Tax=Mesorhizobium TaxID=68287 RepID=UPI000FCACC53|nr:MULTISPECIES: hypothetical protein [unclassified Mesorhizobium]RUT80999.1 hypothetical protein EOD15_33810 [Mesorhizobium sp. M7A.T.Ca.US.000.02.2.1]RUT84260.1 hypothetical protein EOD14_21440 [Mesorhizobium sp. M7A.T.Ca.US.000.02.1.1]RUU49730.1 hypothetical protein EOC99_36205 [Mesorhizobium sp. M7A.T.Ca.TU.009.01.1.1]RUU83234.1 hypothetical protein EOD03_15600 [Mesorhizobium sp. M7A.T.Ca.TU.009.01.1.2]